MSKTCFFTIVSNNYRYFARTLVASVRRHDPDIDAFVAICDEPLEQRDPRDAYTEIPIRDLGLPKFDRFTFQYTILELNTAIKPWVIADLFDRGYERVIYFDPDIKVYGSVAPILARLDGGEIVLTPHLTDAWETTASILRNSRSCKAGPTTSDSSRFAAPRRPGASSRGGRGSCCATSPWTFRRGLFTDQKWIDLVPGMFDKAFVERDPGWNVAYWNLAHRAVARSDDAFSVNGRPLLFFHYSGFAPGAKLLSKHQNRFTMESVAPAVRALAEGYASDLVQAGIEECRNLPYAFGRFADGEPIPDRVRRCYREEFPWDDPHPDLWTADGQAALFDWLNRPAPEHGRTPWLTRFAATLHRQRVDLQRAFPDVEGAHGRGYAHWFVEHAAAQEKVPPSLIEAVRTALDAKAPAAGTDDAATGSGQSSLVRGVYRMAYRAAWGVRRAVKPLTSQSFRHRVRHALMRKAYFDDSYVTPPLTPAPAGVPALAPAPTPHAISYPPHVARQARASGDDRPGVNVIGYLSAESGVGESARSMLRILAAAGIPVNPIEFRVGNMSRLGEQLSGAAFTTHLHAINLFHVNADQMFVARDHLGPSLFEGRYNVGCWAWELGEFPDAFLPSLDLVDEVWALSSFSQQAIALKAPLPVLRVPCSVAAPPLAADRARFGLADGEVAFLAMCDVLSVPERKNPLGVVDAFRRAFPGGEKVRLLLKVGNIEFQPQLKSRLREAQQADPRIQLIVGYLARDALWSLMASIDCFVSLHRAEGFGLGMAEAMACGKSVIATGWSGNVDFTRADNAMLVDYALVALERDLGPYREGQRWAEPDLDSAAAAMRQVALSTALRERLARRGLETVARELSPEALAPMVGLRIDVIDAMLRSHPTRTKCGKAQ